MLYFSEVYNKQIFTEDGIFVGKLKDIIFKLSGRPYVTKLVIFDSHKNKLIVPVQFLKKINRSIVIVKNYQATELEENELFLVKNLLDKQIIDIQGNKVVRVNDVVLQDKPKLYIAGVDIGFLGIIRWLKLESFITRIFRRLHFRLTSYFLSWADIQLLELTRGRVQLKKAEEKLEKIRPEDLADYLERTNLLNTSKILTILNEEYAAQVIGNLNINYQNALFKFFTPERAAKVISLIDPDEAVDILLTLSPKRRELIIALLTDEKRKELEYLFRFSKTPIGELITTEFITVKPEDSVKKIIEQIKRDSSGFSSIYYILVVNDDNQLIGIFNLHELLLQPLDSPAYKFMIQDVVVIHLTTPEEIAIKKMLKYKLQSLPVIDRDRRIVGIVTFDDITEFILKRLE